MTTISIRKASIHDVQELQNLLNEYYEALEIVKRDTTEQTENALRADDRYGFWLAFDDAIAVGCAVLRYLDDSELKLTGLQRATEFKRLYVNKSHRGRHIADLLLDALEQHARERNIQWMYLDSKDDLLGAIRLYKRRGYVECERYNDNPQATLFMRKALT